MKSIVNFFSWSFAGNTTHALFQFVAVIILSRLLSPHEYGIIGIMAIFISIGNMLVDSGLAGSLLQKKQVFDVDYSTLFIYNLFISLLLYAFLFFAAPWVSELYSMPELTGYIRVYCLSIIISAFGVSQHCKLTRNMQFKAIAIILFVSDVISVLLAIILAKHGFGVYSLIFQNLSSVTVRAVLLYVKNGFLKQFSFSIDSFRQQFSFGGWLLLSNLLKTICSNIYSNIIPKIGTIEQNGYYTQSNKLYSVPQNIITLSVGNVVFPYLSRSQNEQLLIERARSIYGKIYFGTIPAFSFFALLSYPLIMIVFGSKWIEATPFLSILMVAGIFELIQVMLRNVLKSLAKTKQILYLEIVHSIVRLAIIIVALFYGIRALLYGIPLASILNAGISMWMVHRNSLYSIKLQLKDCVPIFIYSCIATGVLAIIYFTLLPSSLWALLLIPFGFFIVFSMACICGNQYIIEIITWVKNKWRR